MPIDVLKKNILLSNYWDFLKIEFLELQGNTQNFGRRPFGVGLIIASYDVRNFLIEF